MRHREDWPLFAAISAKKVQSFGGFGWRQPGISAKITRRAGAGFVHLPEKLAIPVYTLSPTFG